MQNVFVQFLVLKLKYHFTFSYIAQVSTYISRYSWFYKNQKIMLIDTKCTLHCEMYRILLPQFYRKNSVKLNTVYAVYWRAWICSSSLNWFHEKSVKLKFTFFNTVLVTQTQCGKMKNVLSPKKISSNHFLSNFFRKNS